MDDDDIDLSPVVPVFRARQLDALIQAWLDWMLNELGEIDANGVLRSETVAGYGRKIAHFRRWWADNGPLLNWELRESDFPVFNRWLTHDSGLSYNSRKDVLRRLEQMFRWAYRRNYVRRDYSHWIPDPDGSAPIRVAAPVSALYDLMQAAGVSDFPRRNQAILAIVIGTGMRRQECCFLAIEDVTLSPDNSGHIVIRHAKKVPGKDDTNRTALFDHHAGRYILAYIQSLGRTSGPLFPGRWHDRPMWPSSMNRIVHELIEAAGLVGKIQNLHDLRRLFITYFRQKNKGDAYDKLLMGQVGHAAATTTDIYDLSTSDELRSDLVSPFSLLHNTGYDMAPAGL